MFRKITLIFIGLIIFSSLFATEVIETYFKFSITSRQELDKLSKIISIDNVKNLEVYAYANEKELSEFQKLGYSYTILSHPGTLYIPKMAFSREEMRDWDYYPTYETYVDIMYQFAIDYPSFCIVENIGYSVEGREILFAKISNNVDIEENEPEFLYTSTMHGDETTGYVLMLHLIDYLLSNYGIDPQVTNLIDEVEVWINPLANPDGTYHGGNNSVWGAIRYNVNGVDLNRNFPDPEDGPHPDGNEWQPETIVMMNLADEHNFVLSANFHSGEEVVNYPWD
ncbi:MAG: hypothetical protein KAT74_00815, partial [Candidatus Cloacimonetes bacterium]|nr:hypothetical protein [Candidatus Cloacimonadota bacterium]